MGRLILYIIWMVVSIVLSIVFPRRRTRFYRRSMYGRNYYGDDHTFDYIRMFIRRRRALSKAKKFIKKKRHTLTLKNANVMFVFDTKYKTFALLDVKNIKRSATVIWAEQNISISDMMDYSSDVDTEMEKTFDSICRSFNDISNYLGILQVLKNKFNNVKENKTENIPQKIKPENTQTIIKKEVPKSNINNLNETELSKLPGISIILAKKIVERINLKGDFYSVEEFYNEMKIKSHFQKQLNDLIYAQPVERKRNTDNDDRIIDL